MFLTSPLEQFRILPLLCLCLPTGLDVSFTNGTLITLISLISFAFLISLLLSKKKNFYIVPNRFQIITENLYLTISGMLSDNLGRKGEIYLPYIFVIFIYVLFSNLIGLIPYGFTTTSHLVVTFVLACIVFVISNVVGIKTHGFQMLSIFYPPNTALTLGLLLVPIEIVSYMFKPISLGVRLFANMMAGHTLLKVIGGFSWAMLNSEGFIYYLHIVPLIILVFLVGLELGVALIQSYVFAILTCIYMSDTINLH
jgi:F-type H+-transporting ATPase subunit a